MQALPMAQPRARQSARQAKPIERPCRVVALAGSALRVEAVSASRPSEETPVQRVLSLCEATLQEAVAHITQVEPRLASVFQQHGLPAKLICKRGSAFHSLAKSIVSQQVSGKAAASIFSRVMEACKCVAGEEITPGSILSLSSEELSACGVSGRKVSYLQGIAQGFHDGTLSEERMSEMSHEQLLTCLTKLKGIGPWTVDMFAMFHLGRPDVLPVGDLAVRKGVQALFELKAEPSPAEMHKLTSAWAPYRSVGSWCMWHLGSTELLVPVRRAKKAGSGKPAQEDGQLAAPAKKARGSRKAEKGTEEEPGAAAKTPRKAAGSVNPGQEDGQLAAPVKKARGSRKAEQGAEETAAVKKPRRSSGSGATALGDDGPRAQAAGEEAKGPSADGSGLEVEGAVKRTRRARGSGGTALAVGAPAAATRRSARTSSSRAG